MKDKTTKLTESRELNNLLLGLNTSRERTCTLVHVGGNSSQSLPNGSVRSGLKVTSSLDADGVLLEGTLDFLRGGDGLSQVGNLSDLLGSEGEPIGNFGLKLLLAGEGHGGVEQRRGSGDNNTVGTELRDNVVDGLEGCGEVVLPDVSSGNESEGESDVGGLNDLEDGIELSASTVEIEVQSVDGELGNILDIAFETTEVSRDGDLEARSGLGERGVGGSELVSKVGGGIENEGRLIDLDFSRASSLELLEELRVDGNELVEDVDGLESRTGLVTGGLADEEVSDGTKEDGAGLDSESLGFEEFVDGLSVH